MTRFNRLTLLFTILLISFTTSLAANITGIVKDLDTQEPLLEAAIKLVAAKDSTFIAGTTTDIDGKFTLSGIKAGKYILTVSYIGYADLEKPVTVGASNLRLGVLGIKESSHMLGEVSVVAVKTPIKVMEDTVEYNADSYHTQPNAVVEDLLKRLPGVEVGTDGSITANGKTISKFLVNGKEFFSDDPQVASKNLPANLIDKLQVVDRKSDMARLTGVDDGEDETVINLTFKQDMNQGWFGTAEAGYGTDDRYTGSFNLNRFWNGNQVTLLGNFNNTNQIGFTDSNGSRFRRFGGNNGITESRALGLNFNVGKEEIIRVGGDIMWSNTDAKTITRQERQYLFEDYSTYSKINKSVRDRGNNFRGDFRVLWKPDSFNTLEFRPNFSINHHWGFTNDSTVNISGLMEKVSTDYNLTHNRGTSYELAGRLIYSHNFKNHRGRSFSISSRYQLSNVREYENSLSEIMYHLLETDDVLDQYADNHTWSNQIMAQATWTEPLGNPAKGHSLAFSYRMNYRWNNADRLTYDIPNDYDLDILPPVGVEPNPDYSNQFRNNYFNQDIRVSYKKVGKDLNYEVGLALVPQMTKSIDYIKSENNMDRWVWNYAPFLRMRYKFNKRRSLQANYRGRSSQPSMSQMQPVPDISDPMNIKIGNPNLDPSFAHNINIRFQDFNMDSQRSIMINGDFSYTQNSIISMTTFNPETSGRETTYKNVNGVWSSRLMNMMSMPLKNKKWTISNHIFGNASQNIGYNNGVRNRALDFNIFESPGIAFRPDNFEFELRPQYSVQFSHNTVQKQSNRTIHRYGGRFDATYYTPWGLTVQSDVNYSDTKGYSAGYDQRSIMWNASLSQQFLKDKALTVSVRVYDLLNQVNSVRRSINANYIDDSESNVLTRYFMFSVSYRFNTFGKGNEPKGSDEFRGGRHGGWGGGRPGGRRF